MREDIGMAERSARPPCPWEKDLVGRPAPGRRRARGKRIWQGGQTLAAAVPVEKDLVGRPDPGRRRARGKARHRL